MYIDGTMAKVNGAEIPLEPAYAKKAAESNGDIKIGIRPMYVELNAEEINGGIPATVLGIEDQGFCKIVTVKFGENEIKARIKDDREIPGGMCWVSFPPEKTKLYSNERLVK